MKRKVLVVDDSLDLLRVIRLALVRAGFKVVTARDGVEGLRKLNTERPSIVLLDLMMPRMDGHGFLKEMHKDPEIRGIPVVVLTARKTSQARDRSFYLGSVRFLTKPVNLEEVVRTLHDHAQAV